MFEGNMAEYGGRRVLLLCEDEWKALILAVLKNTPPLCDIRVTTSALPIGQTVVIPYISAERPKACFKDRSAPLEETSVSTKDNRDLLIRRLRACLIQFVGARNEAPPESWIKQQVLILTDNCYHDEEKSELIFGAAFIYVPSPEEIEQGEADD